MKLPYPELTPDEAAAMIQHDQTIGFSGFTPSGAAKVIPPAIAQRAIKEHAEGRPFKIGVVTGASTGPSLDGELAKADAISFRTPYQSNADLRKGINEGRIRFFDMHLSQVADYIDFGFLGKFNWAVIEACDVTSNGEIVPTTSIGTSPTFCRVADKILVELNDFHPSYLRGIHDIYEPEMPPHRQPIPILRPSDRIGQPFIKVDPKKIVGVVRNNMADETTPFDEPDAVTRKIGENVANFLAAELHAGRVPKEFLPIQSGVGNIANAVLGAMGDNPNIPAFEMYSEVIQDSVIDLIKHEKLKFASGTSLTVSLEVLKDIYDNLEFFRPRMLLRPQKISNSIEVIRRLGIISINTALEVDLFGNVNSTHVMGQNLMNGIGGSGDFTRNAHISIFTCPSTAKGGKISSVVPLCSHMDHSEHSVQVIITEQGIADLRAKDPHERAELIVKNCAHPDFRDELYGYFHQTKRGHTPQTLNAAFAMHVQFLRTGDMRGVNWASLIPNWGQEIADC
ncbi:MAG: acetyl-CoA hydrolase/transferase family protein [Verrucomicrobiota bacterium]